MAKEQRLIDAEPVKKFIVDGLNNKEPNKAFGHDAIEILAEIEYAPTVDAVEVVRCKDCKSWNREDESGGMCTVDVAPVDTEIDGVWRLPCDFCSYGERRSDNAAD